VGTRPARPPDPSETSALRAGLRQMWASVAPSWGAHAAYVDDRGAAVTAAMLDRAAPSAGDRVLELACGPGGVGLAAARRVLPGGSVVLSDLTAAMTAIAASRAAASNLANVSIRELDAERIDEPDASFDVVLCREGLMLMPEPALAVSEIRRVLRPGGRVAIAVWGARARNPWLGVLFDAVTEQTGIPVPPPGVPGPFALDAPEALVSLLATGQLCDVTVEEVASPVRTSSFDEWWGVVPSLAGPIAQVLDSLPDETATAIRASAERELAGFTTSAGYDIPGLSLVASARRA
jgi:SAM-dependent methyltransferase